MSHRGECWSWPSNAIYRGLQAAYERSKEWKKRSEEQGLRNKKRAKRKRKKEKNKKRSIRTIDEKHCL
jgi:hypothetical protein